MATIVRCIIFDILKLSWAVDTALLVRWLISSSGQQAVGF